MGYSEHTPNYDLPQYVANDRPSYLGDWNEAMGKIDAGMEKNKEDTAANGVAITNMREYVDNAVDGVNDSLSNTTAAVDASIAAVNVNLTAMGVRLDNMEDELSFRAPKKVIAIGDSYMVSEPGVRTAIGDQLAAIATNWEFKNYADSGSGFTFGGVNGRTFQQQLAFAAANEEGSSIDYVLIVGGRNEAGPQNSSSTPSAALPGACDSCFAYAKSAFPNAQIFVFPCLYDWKAPNMNVISVYNTMKQAANIADCFTVEGCYTWGSGDESTLYVGGNDIHPNSAGSLYMAHIIYNKVTNKDNNAWRNRNVLVKNANFTLQNGIVSISGAMLSQNEILFNEMPSWMQTCMIYDDGQQNEFRKHVFGIQIDNDNIKVISLSRAFGIFVGSYEGNTMFASNSTFPYVLGS